MDELDKVPCVQVDKCNIEHIWPFIVRSIEQSHFVAIDLEFSGLGDKKKLILKDIGERYKVLCEVAKTRSILSVGLSFFRHQRRQQIVSTESNGLLSEDDSNEWLFKVINFDILTLCTEDSVLEEDSEAFLLAHGFDFVRQKQDGLPYSRGNEVEPDDLPCIRKLFRLLIKKKIPITFHNGFIDLIFIYQNFFANLPNKLTTFVADLNEMFPKGLFDTKYIAEHIFNPKGSYLEYLYYQRQRRNLERRAKNISFFMIQFIKEDSIALHTVERSMKTLILGEKPDGLKICDDYRQYGWCKRGATCKRSHDIDFILDDEKDYKDPSKSRKRLLIKINSIISTNGGDSCQEDPIIDEVTEAVKEHINGQVKSGIHRSGYDAFMTGYCFISFFVELTKTKPGKSGKLNFSTSVLKKIVNKIFLTSSKEPLQIRSSPFSKSSAAIMSMKSKDSSLVHSESSIDSSNQLLCLDEDESKSLEIQKHDINLLKNDCSVDIELK